MSKLLIVDDQESLRELLVAALGTDFDVQCVANGREAVDLIDQWRPDVVLADYSLPGMTGLELARMIQQRKPAPLTSAAASAVLSRAKVVLYSAYLTEETVHLAEAYGVSACFPKPFDLNNLRRVLASLVAN